ncbi:right-handed parallel beta-helix repeat-containing protein [Microbacterium sp. NPDC077663]|uniref:right-handed parallel beta-helix repeat-containing protein n=1 Tax=Microbacterium sp. NPDC077663 TaxID=3364189 RepID=UPI0037CB9B0E
MRARHIPLALAATLLVLTGAAGCVPPAAPVSAPSCPTGARVVGSSIEDLQRAVDAAAPGDVLRLADTTYAGRLVVSASGSDAAPIVLCGSAQARIDGGDATTGYALHVDGAAHWRIAGFAITGASKGIVADAASDIVFDRLVVEDIGEEGIHLRSGTTDSTVSNSSVRRTGIVTAEYGEGIYVGSAESNWCRYTGCEPDRSDRNRLVGNTVSDTTAEAIDIKEGSSGGVAEANTLTLSDVAVVDSAVDVKGNDWRIAGNRVTSAGIGIEVQQVADGWGGRAVIEGNTIDAAIDAYAIDVAGAARTQGSVIRCDNRTASGAEVRASLACTP